VLWRALLAGVLVICCTAGAVTTASLLQVKNIVNDFSHNKPIADAGTVLPKAGAPETVLIVGSDARWKEKGESNTDTMMLARIDASSSTINLLSVPRDLEVTVHGNTAKLNSAWTAGGPKLLIDTLQTQVFPNTDFHVNHILNVDFSGFADLINAIGCVYTMVDHRYFNDVTGANGYSAIDIQPGYQRLCGGDAGAQSALAFVRFRHTDSDLVRESRQQDFIRWARDQYTTSDLADNESTLLKIFGAHVSTEENLHTTNGLLNLANLVVDGNGHDLKNIAFPTGGTTVIGGADYLAPDTTAAVAAYKEFITPTPISSGTTTTTATATTTVAPATKAATTKTAKRSKRKAAVHSGRALKVPSGMIADPRDGQTQASELGSVGIPVYYPDYIPSTSSYCFSATENCLQSADSAAYTNSYPRRYTVRDQSGKRHAAYVMTVYQPSGCFNGGQCTYVSVQGMSWQTPPILRDPTKTVHVNGRTLDEYYNGGELSLVAWHTRAAVYWIANTLQDSIPAGEMVAMAASLELAR
jgi:LCP family protein required for cell wall assembly